MSFSKTISVCAALASIFAAGTAGWKLANENQTIPVEQGQDASVFEEKINKLEEKLKEVEEKPTPEATSAPVVVQQPPVLPPLPPVPEPQPGEVE